MFAEAPRVPCEILSGRANFAEARRTGSVPSLVILTLEAAFDFARETHHAALKTLKESYDLGVNQSSLKPSDNFYIKITNMHPQYGSKLQSVRSTPHEVVECKGVVGNFRNLSNNSLINLISDRLSNPSSRLGHEASAAPNEGLLGDSNIPSPDN